MLPAALSVLFGGRLVRTLRAVDVPYVSHYGLHFVINVTVSVDYGDGEQILEGNVLWTGSPGQRVRYGPSGGKREGGSEGENEGESECENLPDLHYSVALQGSLLDEWRQEGLWPERPIRVPDAPALQQWADRLVAALVGDEALATRQRANALEGLLLELHRQQQDQRPLPSWVLKVQAYLEAHWNQEIDYDILAEQHHMPLRTLRGNFKRATGVAIHTWFLRQRHRQACELLLNSDDNLADIADQCGFEDPAFFSRQFKRFIGMSPKEYRQSVHG